MVSRPRPLERIMSAKSWQIHLQRFHQDFTHALLPESVSFNDATFQTFLPLLSSDPGDIVEPAVPPMSVPPPPIVEPNNALPAAPACC
jgi:hypothetical protein